MEQSVTKKSLYEVLDYIIADCKETGCNAIEALLLVKSNILCMMPENARVLTLEEVKETKICWIEDRNVEHLYPAVYYARGNDRYAVFCVPDVSEDIERISEDSEEYAQFEDKERWLEEDEINEWWRPWSQKPTEEQMEAQEWA